MQLVHLLLITINFGSLLLQAAANRFDAFRATVWHFPQTDYAEMHSDAILSVVRCWLWGDRPEDGLSKVIDLLIHLEDYFPPEERTVNLAILERVLELYGDLVDTEAGWFLELIDKQIAKEDVEVLRIILEHCHPSGLLLHCHRENVRGHGNVQISALVRRWALLHPDPPQLMQVWDFPPTKDADYATRWLRFLPLQLQSAHPEERLRYVVQTLLYAFENDESRIQADEHVVCMIILDAVLDRFKPFIKTDDVWFQDALSKRIVAQDVEAVRVVLKHFHGEALLFQCLGMNLHHNAQITAIVHRWLEEGEAEVGEQEPPAPAAAPVAPAAVPAGPRLQVFRLDDGGVFGEEAGDVHVDAVSGYFHVKNANRIVMGMVHPALNPAALNTNLLNGSLDEYMAHGPFTAASKGMVLWYDRTRNRATLRRIKNTHDATSPALGIFHPERRDFIQLDASLQVVISTLSADRNDASATIPMAPGYIVMAFPQAATDELEPFELNTVLDEFGTNVAEAEIAGNMRDGLLGARPIVREGALYAAYLH
jgi:hypothetical protein